jgi:diguanylate cyclase (GGDEF)-like protein
MAKSDDRMRRPTIGVLVGWIAYEGTLEPFLLPLLQGMQAAAHDLGCSLLLGLGITTEEHNVGTAWPVLEADTDYIPVGPENTDGLIVILPLLSESRRAYLEDLRGDGFPVVNVGIGEPGLTVAVDNEGGIREALEHLHGHGHQRILFVSGLEEESEESYKRLRLYRVGTNEDDLAFDKDDSYERLRTYKRTCIQLGLEADPDLIVWGKHSPEHGYQAVRQALQQGVKFSAVLASDDGSAIGALQALSETGWRVPEGIAIVGFDDRLDAPLQQPPLTTVHYPQYETGRKALELLFSVINGQRPDIQILRVPTHLVVRESCGCHPDWMGLVGAADVISSMPSDRDEFLRAQLEQAIDAAMLSGLSRADQDEVKKLCMILSKAFFSSLKSGEQRSFHEALDSILQWVETHDFDAHIWQESILVLQDHLTILNKAKLLTEQRVWEVERILQKAHVVISQSVRRRYSRFLVQQQSMTNRLGLMSARLHVASSQTQVLDILRESLPGLGIQYNWLSFFEDEGDDHTFWSTIQTTQEDGVEYVTQRFRSSNFPPSNLASAHQPYQMALLPLILEGEERGFVVFEASNLPLCAMILSQITASLQSIYLHDRVVRLSNTDSLTEMYNRRYLDGLLQREVARCSQDGYELSVVMLDLDHFKDFNDSFGHRAGDEALRKVAQSIIAVTHSSTDVAVRYGGEEFLLILPHTGLDGAKVVAENVRKAIADKTDLPEPLTVSLGIAVYEKNNSIDDLINHADQALYQAKHSGRNRSCVYAR